jgi:hypothetical protein
MRAVIGILIAYGPLLLYIDSMETTQTYSEAPNFQK